VSARRGDWCSLRLRGVRCELRFQLADTLEFREALADLKAWIPPSARNWYPDERVWRVSDSHLAEVRDWCFRWFKADELLIEEERPRPPRPAPAPVADPYSVLHLLPTAPPELVKAAYRVMSQLCHPDAGGDHAAMVRINLAFERLQELAA